MVKGEKRIEVLVEELAHPIAVAHGVELVGVELVKEGPNRYLRVFIDKEGGVSFEDCEAVSRAVDSQLDSTLKDPPYDFFEVSSPGLERPLKRDGDFARYAGHLVTITTYAPMDGHKVFVGNLIGLVGDQIVVRLTEGTAQGQELTIERNLVASTRLRVNF